MVQYAKIQSVENTEDVSYLEIHGSSGVLIDSIRHNQLYRLTWYCGKSQVAKWKEEAERSDKGLTSRLAIKPQQARADFIIG
jgi:hypothetical protein